MSETPLDCRKGPVRQKSEGMFSERFSDWFVHGQNKTTGLVDISTLNHGDVLLGVPKDSAEKILAARDVFLGLVFAALNEKHPKGSNGSQD